MSGEALTVEQLDDWALAGAHWRVIEINDQEVVVDLCACTGELVERRRSDDPRVIGYLRTARSDFHLS